MDCAVKQICRPGEMQRTVYDVHKRVHAIKVQAIATPNGLVANLYDPVEGRRHDSEMLLILLFYHFYNNIQLIKMEINCVYTETSLIHYDHNYKPHLLTLN